MTQSLIKRADNAAQGWPKMPVLSLTHFGAGWKEGCCSAKPSLVPLSPRRESSSCGWMGFQLAKCLAVMWRWLSPCSCLFHFVVVISVVFRFCACLNKQKTQQCANDAIATTNSGPTGSEVVLFWTGVVSVPPVAFVRPVAGVLWWDTMHRLH